MSRNIVLPSLTIYVDRSILGNKTEEIYNLYKESADKYNLKRMTGFPDAGFDLYVPSIESATLLGSKEQVKVGFGIRCKMTKYEKNVYDENIIQHQSFYLYPRSSISKTNYRLANSVGIIDSGYRGEIIGVFDILEVNNPPHPGSRLLQICCGDLSNMIVNIEILEPEDVENFVSETSRGQGGFGSTGL